jgi:hypothetical protein
MEARMFNPSYRLPLSSHAWGREIAAGPRVKIYVKRKVECGQEFRYLGNEVYPPIYAEVSKQT